MLLLKTILRPVALTICLLFATDIAIFADTVRLKDGRVIKGVIVREVDDSIKLEVSIAVFTLLKSDIDSIERNTPEENEALLKEWEEKKLRSKEGAAKAQEIAKTKSPVQESKKPASTKKQTVSISPKTSKFTHKDGIDSISTDDPTNSTLKYYYYIPQSVLQNKFLGYSLLVMVPGLSGKGEDFVSNQCREFAEKRKYVIISPSFIWNEKDWWAGKSYQFPEAWSGDALLGIIDKFKKNTNIRITKYYLFGFSAGAQFALRFPFWKPDMVLASAAHGCGDFITVDKTINTKLFVTCGTQDTERIDIVKEFCNRAKQNNIDVTYKTYNIGHSLSTEQINDSLAFFEKVR